MTGSPSGGVQGLTGDNDGGRPDALLRPEVIRGTAEDPPNRTAARRVPADAAVSLREVSKKYGDVTAVDGLSLDLMAGEIFSLLGPSGCGKTTTLKLIAGFEKLTGGELLIQGRAMGGVSPNRRDANTVFQGYALFPHLSVRENVEFGLRMSGIPRRERRRQADEALSQVHLDGFAQRRSDELSGGQQQRVALARALVNRPSVLLLDEPLGALDLKLRRAMQRELKEIQQAVGITFLHVTHDQEEALALGDRVGVMSEGHLEQVGRPTDIYELPATRFVADFIGDASFLEGAVTTAEGPNVELRVAGTVVSAVRSAISEAEISDPATVMVRPEKVALRSSSDEQLPSDNLLRGSIDSIEYHGRDSLYTVALEDGRSTIKVRIPADGRHGGDKWRVGDPAVASFPIEATVLLDGGG